MYLLPNIVNDALQVKILNLLYLLIANFPYLPRLFLSYRQNIDLREICTEALFHEQVIEYVLQNGLNLTGLIMNKHAVKVILSVRFRNKGQRRVELGKFEATTVLESGVLVDILEQPLEVVSGRLAILF